MEVEYDGVVSEPIFSSPESKGLEKYSFDGFGAAFNTGAADDVPGLIRAVAEPPPATTEAAGVVNEPLGVDVEDPPTAMAF